MPARFLAVLLRTCVLLGAALALGCSPAPERLVIAEASQPVFALLYVADAKGFLREAGLEVEFKRFLLGRDALTAVVEGRADLATVYETPVVNRMLEGKPLGILTSLHTSTQNTVLLARADRGIRTAADLAGKRIGITKGTSTEFFLRLLLGTEALGADSVTEVDVEPARYEAALVGGEVDGLVLFEPYHGRLRRLLGDRLVVLRSDAYVETSMLVGMREAMTARPEAMARLAAALIRAQDYAEANADESIRIVAAHLALDEALVRETWTQYRREARLRNVLVATMALEARWLAQGAGDRVPPDFGAAIMAEPLRRARPSAVTQRRTRDDRVDTR